MAIRREYRRFYGPAWRAFRLELIEAQGGKVCSACSTEDDRINGAHTNHDPADRRAVKLLCSACHAAHDARHRIAVMRRRKAEATGQLWLSPEMEWAPYAAWEIPGRIFDRLAQSGLFA